MNRNVGAQISYDRLNKGVDVRNPSTANLLIDSQDRYENANFTVTLPVTETSSNDISITKQNSILNGFFTRFALTEVELTWSIFNISAKAKNNTFTVNVVGGATFGGTLPDGFYTVKACLDKIVTILNGSYGAGYFTLAPSTTLGSGAADSGIYALRTAGNQNFWFTSTELLLNGAVAIGLIESLSIPTFNAVPAGVPNVYNIVSPNLVPYSYIDIVSPQMTSQQDVKDQSSSQFSLDVIYRWVFADDSSKVVLYDEYGYPIYEGYKPFKTRRYLSFPKQIRWDPLIPLGQLQFQIYTNETTLIDYKFRNDVAPFYGEVLEYNLLFLVSEV